MLFIRALVALILVLLVYPALLAQDSAVLEVKGYPNVVRKPVTLWSDGTRLAGDVFTPKDIAEDAQLPAIVLCHGWGGVKSHLNRGIAPRFADAGYVVLAFDYRGWGESDSRLVMRGEMPEPDEDGYVTVKAQAIRELVDPMDQQEDIDAAITFMEGEPHVDPSRIGIWGSSFGAGHVIWRAAKDSRIKAVVSQVGGYQRAGLGGMEGMTAQAHTLAIQRARGEIEPVPQGGFDSSELRGTPHFDRMPLFLPGDLIDDVNVPVQIIQAEKEHYFPVDEHGKWAYEKLKGRVPVEYHVFEGVGHYEIYGGEALSKAMKLEIAFFDRHLK